MSHVWFDCGIKNLPFCSIIQMLHQVKSRYFKFQRADAVFKTEKYAAKKKDNQIKALNLYPGIKLSEFVAIIENLSPCLKERPRQFPARKNLSALKVLLLPLGSSLNSPANYVNSLICNSQCPRGPWGGCRTNGTAFPRRSRPPPHKISAYLPAASRGERHL